MITKKDKKQQQQKKKKKKKKKSKIKKKKKKKKKKSSKTKAKHETTDVQTKNCNRGAALGWLVGKLHGGSGGVRIGA